METIMQLPQFKRQQVYTLGQRLQEKQPFIQVVLGPRQVGKTTAVLQVKESWGGNSIYESADSPAPPGTDWIEQTWQACGNRSKKRTFFQGSLRTWGISKALA